MSAAEPKRTKAHKKPALMGPVKFYGENEENRESHEHFPRHLAFRYWDVSIRFK